MEKRNSAFGYGDARYKSPHHYLLFLDEHFNRQSTWTNTISRTLKPRRIAPPWALEQIHSRYRSRLAAVIRIYNQPLTLSNRLTHSSHRASHSSRAVDNQPTTVLRGREKKHIQYTQARAHTCTSDIPLTSPPLIRPIIAPDFADDVISQEIECACASRIILSSSHSGAAYNSGNNKTQ